MQALLIPIAVAGLLIWAATIRNFGLLAGCVLTIGTGIVLGYDLFHVGSITSDRLLLVLLLATFVVVRTMGETNTFQVSRTDILFGAFIGYLTLSTFIHEWQWSENYPVSRLIFYYLMPACIYWVARQAKTNKQTLVVCFGAIALFGIYLSITALAETRDWYALVFPKYIVDSPQTEFFGRGRGPLLNPIGNGIMISIALVSAMLLWPHVKKVGRVAIVSCVLVLLGGAYCTLTRSVWIGAAGCVGITSMLSVSGYTRRLLIVAALLGGTIVLPVAYQKSKAFKRDKDVSVSDMESSASLRPIFARVAWLMFKDRPIQGVGYGQYLKHNKNYVHDRETPLRLNLAVEYQQHNIWLSLLTETGLIGLSLFTATFLFWIRCGWQLWFSERAPLYVRQVGLAFLCVAFTYFVNGMFHELAIIPMVNMAFFCISGLTVGLWLQYAAPVANEKPVRVLPGFGSKPVTA